MKNMKTVTNMVKATKEGYITITFKNGKQIERKAYKTAIGNVIYIASAMYIVSQDKEFSWKFKWIELKVNVDDNGDTKVIVDNEDKGTQDIQTPKKVAFKKKGNHAKHETIKTCVENDIPVYLYGPAGSGKNFTLQKIAEDEGLDFYFTNSIQQEYKVTGFIDAGGTYHETEFYKAFKNGGLFFLDEMDASIPEVLVLLNAAIANRYFEFPCGRIDAHEDFRVVAAGNTIGNGANEQYTGRLELDQATLDRFVAIEFGYDRDIELMLAEGNSGLVDYIRGLRRRAEEMGIRTTFSYRCIIAINKLEEIMDLQEVLTIAVFKGLDKDTISTLKTYGSTKYHIAFNNLTA